MILHANYGNYWVSITKGNFYFSGLRDIHKSMNKKNKKLQRMKHNKKKFYAIFNAHILHAPRAKLL